MADLGKGRGAWTRAAQAEGDALYRAAWFDGQRPSVLNMEENTYTAPTEPGPKRFPRVSPDSRGIHPRRLLPCGYGPTDLV